MNFKVLNFQYGMEAKGNGTTEAWISNFYSSTYEQHDVSKSLNLPGPVCFIYDPEINIPTSGLW